MSNAKLEKKLCLARDNPEPIFDLSECDIKRIPNGIFSVIKVLRKEVLYLQNNELTSLKEGGNLQDLYLLKLLDLRSNKISKFPAEIYQLKNLQILRLDNNQLTSLPAEIGYLHSLEHLTVSSNRLELLPDSIGDLRNLLHLDLRLNKHLCSLPVTIYKNKQLQSLLLDVDHEWTEPPTAIVRSSAQAVIAYFAKKKDPSENDKDETCISGELFPSKSLQQLSLYDEYIQDNLRRLEKEKDKKISEKVEMEKHIFNQKEKELFLRQQSQKLMENLSKEQRRFDEEISKCCRQREEEQNNFIRQLQSVEYKADEVIEQLLETNNAQKQKYVSSIVSSLNEEIPVQQNLQQQKVLETMEKLLAEKYLLSIKLQEAELNRQNLINLSSLNEKQLENKIFDLLSKRRNEQSCLIDGIQNDTNLQYAAVLMLIEKSDDRNVELQNQISIIQNQLSNLTAIELQNRNLHVNKHINELVERRIILTNLLQDIFAQQQSHRKRLIDQLKEVENFQSTVNKTDYWIIQFQRLLDCNNTSLSAAFRSIDSTLIYELALLGVSHYAPLLSTLDLKSVGSLSKIEDGDLVKIGIKSLEDRCAVLKAIRHFINDQNSSNTLASAPDLHSNRDISSESLPANINYSNSDNDVIPTAPRMEIISDSNSVHSLNDVLVNECVICLEKQSNIVFLPCGHLCNCTSCSLCVNRCPLCRCDIESKMQIFTA